MVGFKKHNVILAIRKLHNFVFDFKYIPPGIILDSNTVNEYLYDLCLQKNFKNNQIENFYIVTDEGRNVAQIGKGLFRFLYPYMGFLEKHGCCMCHVFNTISKRAVVLYKKGFYENDVRKTCKDVAKALEFFHGVIIKLRYIFKHLIE